jgi:hypothetical protein
MPTLVPFIHQNEPQSTRTALPQPPALFVPPGNDYCPLDHTSPHTEPSASICTAAAAAIDKQDKADAVDAEDIWCAAAAATIDTEEQANEDESSEEGVEDLNEAFDDLVGAKTSGLDNLDYSSNDNNDDYFQEIEDKAHLIEYSGAKKVCHGCRQTNIIPGGPKPPNYSGMSSAELAEAKKEYKRERKRYTDGLRIKPDSFTGCLSPTLQPMTEVISFWLDVNHNFPNKEIHTLRVAEEVNLRGINFVCSRSDVRDFKCTGYRFCVIAHQSKHQGWLVNTACVCKRDEFVNFDNTLTKSPPKKSTLLFRTKWIVPLILPVIMDTPGISNKNLRQYLLGYGKEQVLTDCILQEARTEAKAQLFGKSEENVQYAKGMKTYLERSGHVVKLCYTSRKETIRNVEHLVVSKELLRLKAKDNSTLNKEGRSAYWNTWKKENYDLLVNQLGYKTTKGHFLYGVFYAPSFSKATVPKLQMVFMVDACHLNFGKYTMFSCYGVAANANMLPVGFAIIFGNENASSWKDFWRFVFCTHPLIDRGEVTIISDQDKGIKSAIEEVL